MQEKWGNNDLPERPDKEHRTLSEKEGNLFKIKWEWEKSTHWPSQRSLSDSEENLNLKV